MTKIYSIIIKNETEIVERVFVAKTKKEATDEAKIYGEIVRIQDSTKNFNCVKIGEIKDCLFAKFSPNEINVIIGLLKSFKIFDEV